MRLHNFVEDMQDVEQDAMQLLELGIFFEEFGRLDEGIFDKIKDIKGKTETMLKKIGIHTSQSKGLIQYLWGFNKGIVKLLYHGMTFASGSPQEKALAKDSMKTILKSVTKEQVLDFLYKLDQLTLHTITGPLHALDSITGWHIMADIKKKIEPAISKAKKAIEWLESAKDDLSGKLKTQLQKYMNAIRRVFNFGDFKTVNA